MKSFILLALILGVINATLPTDAQAFLNAKREVVQLRQDILLCIPQLDIIVSKFIFSPSQLKNESSTFKEILMRGLELFENIQGQEFKVCYTAYKGLWKYLDDKNSSLEVFRENWKNNYVNIMAAFSVAFSEPTLAMKNDLMGQMMLFESFFSHFQILEEGKSKPRLNFSSHFNFDLTKFITEFLPVIFRKMDPLQKFSNHSNIKICFQNIASFLNNKPQNEDGEGFITEMEYLFENLGEIQRTIPVCLKENLFDMEKLNAFLTSMEHAFKTYPITFFLEFFFNAENIGFLLKNGMRSF